MGKAPRGFFVDGFSTRVAREGKAVFAMWGKAFPAMPPEPCPAGDPPAPISPPHRPPPSAQTPRNPGGNPGRSLRAADSPSEGAEDGFLPRSLGEFRQKSAFRA